MRILALDQALTVSGYAIIDLDNTEITFGHICAPKRKGKSIEYGFYQRIVFIRDTVKQILIEHNCEQLVLEEPFISGHQHKSNAQSLQQVYGSLQVLAFDLKIPIVSMRPRDWARLLNLKTTKAELLLELQPKGVVNNHQSDAIGVGLAALIQTEQISSTVDRLQFNYKYGPLYKLC
jgi:Holliday junction resolvasome RuvABC endonuclease subunit